MVVWYQPNSVQVCHSQGRNTKLTSGPFQAVVAMSWRLDRCYMCALHHSPLTWRKVS